MGAVLAVRVEGPLPGRFDGQLHAEGVQREGVIVHLKDQLAGEQGTGAVLGGAIEYQRRGFDDDVEGGRLMGEGFGGALGRVRQALKR